MTCPQRLKIGFFNINGLIGNKTFDPAFVKITENYDIIGITETWHTNDECIQKIKKNIPPKYRYFENARKNKHKKSKRNSGGILILYKDSLEGVITLLDKKIDNMLWIKIYKKGINTEKDLNIGVIYNSPINSSYAKTQTSDFFLELQTKMTSFTQNDYVIIGGDFNARTGTMSDFIVENNKEIHTLNLPDNYCIDELKNVRNNQDHITNAYGGHLVDFCISTKMKIMNGRTLGDFIGKYTYIGYNGVSVVDYVLASETFLMTDHVNSFSVENMTSLSDHRPISLDLKFSKNTNIQPNIRNIAGINPNKPKRLNIQNLEAYKKVLGDEMSQHNIVPIMNKLDENPDNTK